LYFHPEVRTYAPYYVRRWPMNAVSLYMINYTYNNRNLVDSVAVQMLYLGSLRHADLKIKVEVENFEPKIEISERSAVSISL